MNNLVLFPYQFPGKPMCRASKEANCNCRTHNTLTGSHIERDKQMGRNGSSPLIRQGLSGLIPGSPEPFPSIGARGVKICRLIFSCFVVYTCRALHISVVYTCQLSGYDPEAKNFLPLDILFGSGESRKIKRLPPKS